MSPLFTILAGRSTARYVDYAADCCLHFAIRTMMCDGRTNASMEIGNCAAGALQLLVFSILEIATDLLLIAIPMRQLIKLQLPWIARIRLIVLFSVGLSIIAVTLLRLLMNTLKLHRSGASHDIANIEVLFAAIVANAPPIYGLLRRQLGSSARSKSSNALQDGSSRSRVELNTIGSKTSVPRIKSRGYTDITNDAHSDEERIFVSCASSIPFCLFPMQQI